MKLFTCSKILLIFNIYVKNLRESLNMYIRESHNSTLANVMIVLIANVLPPNCTVYGLQT